MRLSPCPGTSICPFLLLEGAHDKISDPYHILNRLGISSDNSGQLQTEASKGVNIGGLGWMTANSEATQNGVMSGLPTTQTSDRHSIGKCIVVGSFHALALFHEVGQRAEMVSTKWSFCNGEIVNLA